MDSNINELKSNIQIREKINQQKLKDYVYLAIFIMFIFIILFSLAKIIKTSTKYYSTDISYRWYTVLSYDDVFYSRNIYTDKTDYDKTLLTIVKHPLMRGIGHTFTFLEKNFFQSMDKTDHYFHIVVFQILVNLIGTVYLYKILREQLQLRNRWCFLLLIIYQLATVTILGTLMVETFIISGTLLIMSYYYLNKQKLIPSIILGILATGVTLTNCIPFAIMAVFLLQNKKDIFKVGITCIIGLIVICFMLPYREFLVNNFIDMIKYNADTFVEEQTGITWGKMVFYNLLSSPIFFITQTHTLNKGMDFVTFALHSGKVIAITTIIFFIAIIYNIIKNIKDRKLLAALGVFIYNMILHGIVKFGLYEGGTIYGLHFLFVEILMFAFGFKIKNKKIRYIFITFALFMTIVQLRYNIKGFLDILLLFKDWK